MPWFRRRKNDSDLPAAAAAAPAVQTTREPQARAESPVTSTPAAGQATGTADSPSDPTRPKRRRGSRGGRGRKKPSTAAAGESTAQAEVEKSEKPEKSGESGAKAEKPAARKSERSGERKQLSQRQERRREQGRRRQPPRRAPLPAAKRELIVSVDVGEQRVAILEDDQVAEVYLERPNRRSIAGNIYLGTVDNVLPGMEAAFVEIGLEKNGFLYVDEIVGPELERGHGRKIQDLIKKGETILVQSVKDPMKTKGARLTTQISLPGRFVVFVPQGEGLGVSRRLEDDERARLKDILRKLDVKEGGIIVRTAAEGASEEDIERDLVFLQRLWRTIEAKAKPAKAPELIYQEAELPLRVTRDLFTGDFEKAYVDNDQAYKRIVGYLKKTSPHMVERVIRYKETPPLMEAFGVEQEIKSTLNRRVDLPSGGYLIFDYAEAFTVIDVNTGRFVGSRGKNSAGRLEDTITKNNLEAVKEVVRQLRLRDIGGIIVIDFIDMANPKNRAAVEEALRTELERDRTKTYVVEISPLGLVEMTRQNVTDGPREVMTKKCPTCGGDGIVYSEASAALDVERRLRALAAGSKSQAFRVELADGIASALIGPGANRLIELEALTKKRFFLEGKPGAHLDHFLVAAEGKLADLAPEAPVEEGAEVQLQLVEVDRHDGTAAVGKLDGLDVVVGEAAELVGKKVKVRIERVLGGIAYGTLVRRAAKKAPEPLTAEAEAEKPTRKPPARKAAAKVAGAETAGDEAEESDEARGEPPRRSRPSRRASRPTRATRTTRTSEAEGGDESAEGAAPKRKRTRRGSRGGRRRKKKPVEAGEAGEIVAADESAETGEVPEEAADTAVAAKPAARKTGRAQAGRRGAGAGRPDPRARRRLRSRALRAGAGRAADADPAARAGGGSRCGGRGGRRGDRARPPTATRRRSRSARRAAARAAGAIARSRQPRPRTAPRPAAETAEAEHETEDEPETAAEPVVESDAGARGRAGARAADRSRCPETAPARTRAPTPTSGVTCRCPSGSTRSTPRSSDGVRFRYTAPRSRAASGPRFHAMSYAIITLGGKQYRVQEGERLFVDRLATDEGATFEPRVLLVGGDGKTDLSPSATVTARVVGHVLGEKIRIGKYKRRTGYKRHNGYRSRLTQIQIEAIGAAGRKAAPKKEAAAPKAEAAGARHRGADGRGAGARSASAEGLRGADGRADRRGSVRLAPAEPRGRARVRARAREPQGRDRRARVGPRREGGELTNGTQEGTRLVAERSRLEPADARREDVRRPGRLRRHDPRPPARHALPPGRRHRDRQGRHDLREARRQGRVPHERRPPLHQRRLSYPLRLLCVSRRAARAWLRAPLSARSAASRRCRLAPCLPAGVVVSRPRRSGATGASAGQAFPVPGTLIPSNTLSLAVTVGACSTTKRD